ncbi:acyltransferase family protein [Legionella gresilensis]|uniref:acyltransferase family protein n=1 Tax=Legionella gresilensis TaxID=91823 RepID=UPI001040FBB1|nr:acyltransferase [Legionella gresilensis]
MNKKVKLDVLTSLRFFAAAMIVIDHAAAEFNTFYTYKLAFVQGVSFFFVLSGFILAYNYSSFNNFKDIKLFWKARLARIWPVHITAILLMISVTGTESFAWLNSEEKIFIGIANIFLVQAWLPYMKYCLAYNAVAWSISTEFFFYFLFPFLRNNCSRAWKKILLVLISIVFFNFLLGIYFNIPLDGSAHSITLSWLLYINPSIRVLEFFIGIMAYMVYESIKPVKGTKVFSLLEIGVFALCICSLWATPKAAYLGFTGPWANLIYMYLARNGSALVFGGLIIIFALQRGVISGLLKKNIFVFLGEISFALYLTHRIVLRLFSDNELLFANFSTGQTYLLYWISSILVAYFIYILIEKPSRTLILNYSSLSFNNKLSLFFNKKLISQVFIGLIALSILPFLKADGRCLKEECTHLKETAIYQDIATYQDFAVLQAIAVDSLQDNLILKMLWMAINVDAKMKIILHGIDKDNNIFWQKAYSLSKAKGLKKGEEWINQVQIPRGLFTNNQTVALGILMVKDNTYLIPVASAKKLDFDGRRALLTLTEFKK